MHLRERVVQGGPVTTRGTAVTIKPAKGHAAERAAMRAARWTLDHPAAWRTAQKLTARTRGLHPRRLPGRTGKAWTGTRDLPAVPAESFRDWWRKRERPAVSAAPQGGPSADGPQEKGDQQ